MSDSMEIQAAWAWEDWVDMVLGSCLAWSPCILWFSDDPRAAAPNGLLVGIAVAALRALTFLAYSVIEEWVDVVLGAWLIVSPWVLSGSPNLAVVADFVIVGALVAGLSGYEIWASR